MPYVTLVNSPLMPGVSPVQIFYRECGTGLPLIFLHGGWGYDIYSFEHQINNLSKYYRCIVPDRSGYGRSTPLTDKFPADFHYRAAEETVQLMNSLGIERAIMWGHSDGAVIAAILGFTFPDYVSGLILEAFHLYGRKLKSRDFFVTLAREPESLGEEISRRFSRDFGENYWRHLITSHAKAWLELGEEVQEPRADLYSGRLSEIRVPIMFIHGRLDPRTEAGELDDVSRQLPNAEMQIFSGGTHSPHSEPATRNEVTSIAATFLGKLAPV